MTLYEKIEAALSSLEIPIEEDFFGDGQEEYITFTLTRDDAAVIADGEPVNEVSRIAIHWFLPRDVEYAETQKKIRRLLLEADFTWPAVTVIVEPDHKTRHIVFECEVENDDEMEVE